MSYPVATSDIGLSWLWMIESTSERRHKMSERDTDAKKDVVTDASASAKYATRNQIDQIKQRVTDLEAEQRENAADDIKTKDVPFIPSKRIGDDLTLKGE